MSASYLNVDRFGECLNEFVQMIKELDRTECEILSFKEEKGVLYREEGYKRKSYQIEERARNNIHQNGNTSLCSWLIESTKSNNLLGWRDIEYLKAVIEKSPEEADTLLDKLYYGKGNDDDRLFRQFTDLFGERYPIISYIFFLKDKDQYLPVRARIFKERFKYLEIDDSCLKRCTWGNYRTFCAIIGEVQQRLNACGKFGRVDLIDAHSFVWMMWKLQEPDESGKTEPDVYHDPENRKSFVCNAEGKIIKYYGTRYERSQRNREAAIAEHGCKCMVCGFDFEKVYGELGKGYIEVHHIEPLYIHGGKIKKVNPKTDLVCLCSNCHSMIHRKKGEPMKVEELKAICQLE